MYTLLAVAVEVLEVFGHITELLDTVVLVEEDMITGMLSGKNARVRTDWEGKTYECLIHVRKDDSTTPTEPQPTEPEPTEPEPTEPEPTEPEHVHDWKLNKASSGSETTGDVPRSALVESATPMEAINRPRINTA